MSDQDERERAERCAAALDRASHRGLRWEAGDGVVVGRADEASAVFAFMPLDEAEREVELTAAFKARREAAMLADLKARLDRGEGEPATQWVVMSDADGWMGKATFHDEAVARADYERKAARGRASLYRMTPELVTTNDPKEAAR